MDLRITLEPAFVLHSRPYSNTSLIVELLTEKYGRIAAVARSARGPKSRYRGKLQLFTPMLVSWVGRNELKSLGEAELCGMPCVLDGDYLLSGFYLNELLVRLLQHEDPHPQVFLAYHSAILALSDGVDLQPILRRFEKCLIDRMGYGLPLAFEAQTDIAIVADKAYRFIPEQGFLACEAEGESAMVFSGRSLVALHRDEFDDAALLKEMKYLMRMVLSRHLGNRPLKTRELMV